MTSVKIQVGTAAHSSLTEILIFSLFNHEPVLRSRFNPEVDDKTKDFLFSVTSGQAGKLRLIRHSWSHSTQQRGRIKSQE